MPELSPKQPSRTPIVLVHGVGDPKPGDLLRGFAANLSAGAGIDLRLEPARELWLDDRSRPRDDLHRRFFPVHVGEAVLNGEPVVFAEVFWGGVSRLPSGVAGAVKGLFSLIFGLKAAISPHLDEQAPSRAERSISRLGRLVSELLRGPLLVATALLLTGQVASESTEVARWLFYFLAVGGFGIGVWILIRARGERGQPGRHAFSEYRSLAWSCLGTTLLLLVLSVAGRRDLLGEILNGVGELVLGFAWLAALAAIAVYGWSLRRRGRGAAISRSLGVKTIALIIQAGLWTLAVPLLWILVSSRRDSTGELRDYFYRQVPQQGLQWLMLALVAAAALLTLLIRQRRVRRDETPPRLLVGGLLEAGLIGVALYGVLASAAIVAAGRTDHLLIRQLPATLTEWLQAIWVPSGMIETIQNSEWEVLPFLVLLLASSFLVGSVRVAFDIANDIINYLTYHVATTVSHSATWDTDMVERQRPIRNTFNEVVRFLSREYDFDKMIVVAHSQGTIIALDELAQSNFGHDDEWLDAIDVRLVTMGSPMAHVYQHYFPVGYPAWSDATRWGRLEPRIDRWLNLYRIDDAIGTTMNMPSPQTSDFGFSEICLGKGGHSNYWRDSQVAEAIREADILP